MLGTTGPVRTMLTQALVSVLLALLFCFLFLNAEPCSLALLDIEKRVKRVAMTTQPPDHVVGTVVLWTMRKRHGRDKIKCSSGGGFANA